MNQSMEPEEGEGMLATEIRMIKETAVYFIRMVTETFLYLLGFGGLGLLIYGFYRLYQGRPAIWLLVGGLACWVTLFGVLEANKRWIHRK